jgi:hypothetical protein
MPINQCPKCSAGVMPGQLSCNRCGYDFIKGTNPEEWIREDDSKRRATTLAVAGALLLVVAAVGGYFLIREPPPPPREACVDALASLSNVVKTAVAAGKSVPDCADTPPGSVSCWAPMGLTLTKMPTAPGERYRLTPTGTGFDLECRVDRDKDGKDALYRETQDVAAVRITGIEVI